MPVVIIALVVGVSSVAASADAPTAGLMLAQDDDLNLEETGGGGFMGKIKGLWAELKKGGRTMYLLLFLSVMGLAFLLERIFVLRRGIIVPKGLAEDADDLWKQGRLKELEQLGQNSKSTLGRIIAYIARHPNADVATTSTAAGDIGSRDLRRQLQRAYPLAVVATLSPLLGLFGTVIGMIESFDKFTMQVESLADPTMFAGSISKALITTAAGLAIAVPTLGAYHFFRTRTSTFGLMLEEQVSEMINEWKMAGKREDLEQGAETTQEA